MGFQRYVVIAIIASGAGLAPAFDAVAAAAEAPSTVQHQHLHDMVNAELGLVRSELISFTFNEQGGGLMTAEVRIANQAWTLDLAPHSVRSEHYQVYRSDADGMLTPVTPGPVRTMRGVIQEDGGSIVAASMTSDGFLGLLQFSTGERWWIEPVANVVDGLAFDTHVLYHERDVIAHDGTCGGNAAALADREAARVTPEPAADGPADGGSLIRVAEHACDADFDYYQDWGSSISNVEDRINSVMNTVNVQYESEVGIRHEITGIIVRTSPFYDSNQHNTLLGQFRNDWIQNQGSIPRDVAQLFTGKNLQGSVIGVAWTLGGICTTGSYCLSQSDFSGNFNCVTDLSAHELGHLWNGFHCNCPSFTMNPSITCANTFSQGTINSISAHRDSRDCLDALYCEGDSDSTGDEFISNVAFDWFSQSSGSSSYTDNFAFAGSIVAGQSKDITITLGNSSSQAIGGVWVDWNRDGVFDTDESITTSLSGNGPYVASVAVPISAPPGTTRMRVRVQNGNDDPVLDPCGTTSTGEVEDYGVKVFLAAAPSNNDCASALPIGVGSVEFGTFGATTDGPFEPQLCDNKGDQDIHNDIWFSFSSPCGGQFTASLCESTYDTKIGIYESCPSGPLEIIACNDDACGVQSEVTFSGFVGTTFLIRVGGHDGATGAGTLTITSTCLDAGACCFTNGTCDSIGPAECATLKGVFQGIGVDCNPTPCIQPGACCFADGTCVETDSDDCLATSGTYQGDGIDCTTANCPQPDPTGACCDTGGGCSVLTQSDCGAAGGTYLGDDAPCEAGSCQPPCPADLDGSGDVGFGDILELIGLWGPCPGCPQDLDGSGDIGFGDILELIGVWGPC